MATVEYLRVVHLDRDRSILAIKGYRGGSRSVIAPLQAVIADAIRLGSAGLLLSHNHPGGDPTPSAADRVLTMRLARAAEAIGIKVHDHLIYGAEKTASFRAMGLL